MSLQKPIQGHFPYPYKFFPNFSNFLYFPFSVFFFLRLFFLTFFSFSELFLGMGRFKILVESKERMEKFKADYRIPPNVGLRYCGEGEWHFLRQEGEAVIPMIAFIEGGMRIFMGPVMRDYLRFVRLAPTQCVPNVFRILGCVNSLNEKMELVLAFLVLPLKVIPPSQDSKAFDTASQQPSKDKLTIKLKK